MKAIILAGGLGTRLAEETEIRPKPMVEIGGRPILWHIMKHFAHHGIKEFLVALGYRGEHIKRYFLEYATLSRDLTIELGTGHLASNGSACEDWRVHLVDTGLETNTGGRIKRLQRIVEKETFMVTYGDGVADIDLQELLAFHRAHGKIATITAVRPPARYGGIIFDGTMVAKFTEKPQSGEGWINGGFLVFEPAIFRYVEDDRTSLEAHTLERLAADGELAAYRHDRFWQCMDTLRDKRYLEKLWQEGRAPWRVWS
jgi:glucose-1-phosphate cytidylyltransferase